MTSKRFSQVSTAELLKEISFREKNPTWFIRDLVADGFDLGDESFQEATAWMDDTSFQREE